MKRNLFENILGKGNAGNVKYLIHRSKVGEFDTWLRRTFFPAHFHLSPLLKHVRKVVGGFGKKVVLVLV